jgi:hypothetical protein
LSRPVTAHISTIVVSHRGSGSVHNIAYGFTQQTPGSQLSQPHSKQSPFYQAAHIETIIHHKYAYWSAIYSPDELFSHEDTFAHSFKGFDEEM